jgi:hypothetical protein
MLQITVLPTHDCYQFRSLDAIGRNGAGMAVAVPSCLYNIPSIGKPLARVRSAIKDNVKLGGTESSMGCRSFLATYDEDEETADYVKKLIDLGVIIVGKTKMTALRPARSRATGGTVNAPSNLVEMPPHALWVLYGLCRSRWSL